MLSNVTPTGLFSKWIGCGPVSQAPAAANLQSRGVAVVAACNPSTHLERIKNAANKQKPIFVEREHRCFVFLRAVSRDSGHLSL